MSVTVSSAAVLTPVTDARGVRWYNSTTLNGDASGGTSTINVFFNPWADFYCILDRFFVYSNNAATDYFVASTIQFEYAQSTIDLANLTSAEGSNFYHRQFFEGRGMYLGHAVGVTPYISFVCGPNTNLKTFSVWTAGRILFAPPGSDDHGIQ